jgi:hypothetical protein
MQDYFTSLIIVLTALFAGFVLYAATGLENYWFLGLLAIPLIIIILIWDLV